MVFLSEMVRKIADETEVLDDATHYDTTATTDWTTVKTQSVTLTKTQAIYVKFVCTTSASTIGAGRVRIDNVRIVSTGYMAVGQSVTREVYIVKTAGTYSITFESSVITIGASPYVRMEDLRVGLLNFSDTFSNYIAGTYGTSSMDSEKTVIDTTTVATTTTRLTPVGTIKNYVWRIVFHLTAPDYRLNALLNVGDGLVAGKLNWKLYIDGAQADWPNRVNDYGADASNSTFADGAYSFLHNVYVAATAKTVKITCQNQHATDHIDVGAYVWAHITPWIIHSSSYEPVNLQFPQGSTCYVVTEPCATDPSKNTKIGKVRFASYGDTTDFYSIETGTGILIHDYIFETVVPESCILNVSGEGGCISMLAVDIR